MNETIRKQLALDYCCGEEKVADRRNHFTVWRPLAGRRRFDSSEDGCFLKIAVINGKLLATGDIAIVSELEQKFRDYAGAWFMDAGPLSGLEKMLAPYGRRIEQVHPFFVSEKPSEVRTEGYDIKWYRQEDIRQFEGDKRFEEAFAFSAEAPDVLGVAAMKDGVILGMAGASEDSPYLWQVGINTTKGNESRGIASMLVSLIKNEILRRGKLPYYGTAMSHIASQRVALNAGFLPVWTELITARISR